MTRFCLQRPSDLPPWSVATPGQRVRILRLRRAMTQAQLATRAGVAVRTVHTAEVDPLRQRFDVVLSIAHALGVPCDAFARIADDPDPVCTPTHAEMG